MAHRHTCYVRSNSHLRFVCAWV